MFRAAVIAGVALLAAPAARAGLPPVYDRPVSLQLPVVPEGVMATHRLVVECRNSSRDDGCRAQWVIEATSARAASLELPSGWNGPRRLAIAAGQTATATLSGRLEMISYSPYVYGGGALRYRHVVIGPLPRYWRDVEYHSLIVKAPRGSAPQKIALEVHHPADWELDEPSVYGDRGRDVVRVEWTLAPPTFRPLSNRVGFKFSSSRFNIGGPVARVMLRGLGDETPTAGGHLGFEVGYDKWLVASIGAEIDSDSLIAIPAASLHTPVPPLFTFSLSAGIGLPIRIDPDPDIGARLFAELSFYFVGFGGGVDLFFGAGSAEADARPMLFFRASL